VDDLVTRVMALMDTPGEVTGPDYLGNPHEITVRELAERVIALVGKGTELVRRPLPQDDPTAALPRHHPAKTLLGWSLPCRWRKGCGAP